MNCRMRICYYSYSSSTWLQLEPCSYQFGCAIDLTLHGSTICTGYGLTVTSTEGLTSTCAAAFNLADIQNISPIENK